MDKQRLPHPAIFLPWLVIAFSFLWLKRDLLLGVPLGGPESIGLSAKIAEFKMDIPLLFGIIPLAVAFVFYFLRRSWRLPLLTAACLLLEVAIYAEGRSLVLVGQFASFRMMLSAISWGAGGTGVKDYLRLSGLIKLAFALGVILASAFLAHRLAKGDQRRHSRYLEKVVAAYIAVVLFASVLCWAVPQSRNHLSASIATILVKSSLDLDTVNDPMLGFQNDSMAQLIQSYRKIAQAPASERDTKYWGKAKDQNVIFFVMETGPARYLDVAGDLSDYPNFARLREHSLVADDHHSTFPLTNRAYLSIFTSLYPPAKKGFQSFPHRSLPGVISSLREDGYETGAYGPLWTGESDDNLLKSIGFDNVVVPPGGINNGSRPWPQKVATDQASLQSLEADINTWNKNGKKFAVAFLPQIGHGPWPDMTDDGGRQSVAERGRALMRLEDKWLGDLLQILKDNNLLSNTVIVLTADHGIRDNVEDPAFRTGMIDDYSYHVPMMVYSTSAFHKRDDITWLTSHIDIAPTVLDLLGINAGRALEQGAPIWQQDLRSRTTFFLASHYLGCDGFYSGRSYYMVRYMTDTAYESPVLHFNGEPLPGPQAAEVNRTTTELNALQSAMFLKLSLETNLSSDPKLRAAN